MQLVHHQVTQLSEQAAELRTTAHQQRFQALRRGDQDIGRALPETGTPSGYVSMPRLHTQIDCFGHRGQATGLVIDQGAQRGDAKAAQSRTLELGQVRHDRQEGRFGLTASRRCRDDDIVLPAQYQGNSLCLDLPQCRPTLLPHPALDAGM